jgi:hypothetical protein
LPDLARFYRDYKSRGVAMIGVSLDDEETADQTVPPVLRQHRVEYPVLVVKQNLDQFADRFDKEWRGEVPRFYLYDQSGKRVKAWSGKTSYAKLEAEVKRLLQSRAMTPRVLPFHKMEGVGNDFVLIEAEAAQGLDYSDLAVAAVPSPVRNRRGWASDCRARGACACADANVQPRRHRGLLRERLALRRALRLREGLRGLRQRSRYRDAGRSGSARRDPPA